VRKATFFAVAVAVVVVALVPVAVLAVSGNVTGPVKRQSAAFTTDHVTTTSKTFANITALSGIQVCAVDEVSVNVSLGLSGAAADAQVMLDGVAIRPGAVRFQTNGKVDSFSFTFVTNATASGGFDNHVIDVQWRSVSGLATNLYGGTANVIYNSNGTCQ